MDWKKSGIAYMASIPGGYTITRNGVAGGKLVYCAVRLGAIGKEAEVLLTAPGGTELDTLKRTEAIQACKQACEADFSARQQPPLTT